ncbi:MAG: thioredoxin family protein [Bacteroidales bacterium]|nr:thioredoxin family protein [Bacteroidales bacterium]
MNRLKALFLALCMMVTATLSAQLNPAHWKFNVKELSATEVELQFQLKLDDGWHIYSQKSDPNGPIPAEFTFTEDKNYKRIGGVAEAKPHEEMDDIFKCVVRSFSGKTTFRQKIKRNTDKAFEVKGSMYYQLCNDGSCIAPDDMPFTFKVPETSIAPATEDTAKVEQTDTDTTDQASAIDTMAKPEEPKAELNEAQDVPEDKKQQSLFGLFFGALLAGILTMFTPCVFPMIPMTVNFFMHSSDNKRKNRRQAWAFGLSIVFIFAVIGALLSLVFGPDSLNFIGTHGIPNLIFFVIFFIFSLSFFGLFEIKMPEKWVNASDAQADKGGLMAPFFIALTTVLVSFSCTGPIISAALVEFATSTTNRWIGLVSMLGFGLGFALPFTLLAFFPTVLKNMKSGGWLNSVKIVFAFLELAFGLKFLSMADLFYGWRLLDREVYLALWIVIFTLMGIYLMGKIKFKGDEDVHHIGIIRLFLIIATFSFVVYMVPGMFGAPLKAISGFIPPMNTQDFNIERLVSENNYYVVEGSSSTDATEFPSNVKFKDQLHKYSVPGYHEFYDLDEAKAYAKQQNKPIFIDFTGINCGNCRLMEQAVWTDDAVKKMLNEKFVLCALYCDANSIELDEADCITDDNGRVLNKLGKKNLYFQRSHYKMNAQPYYVIIDANDPDNKPLTKDNYSYSPDVDKFMGFLNEGLENYSKK